MALAFPKSVNSLLKLISLGANISGLIIQAPVEFAGLYCTHKGRGNTPLLCPSPAAPAAPAVQCRLCPDFVKIPVLCSNQGNHLTKKPEGKELSSNELHIFFDIFY